MEFSIKYEIKVAGKVNIEASNKSQAEQIFNNIPIDLLDKHVKDKVKRCDIVEMYCDGKLLDYDQHLNSIIAIGDSELNLDKMQLRHEENIINLTKSEYALFVYLWNNKNKCISQNELLHNALNYKNLTSKETSTIVTHIVRLRKKINKAGSKNIKIISVRGVGYILEINED